MTQRSNKRLHSAHRPALSPCCWVDFCFSNRPLITIPPPRPRPRPLFRPGISLSLSRVCWGAGWIHHHRAVLMAQTMRSSASRGANFFFRISYLPKERLYIYTYFPCSSCVHAMNPANRIHRRRRRRGLNVRTYAQENTKA